MKKGPYAGELAARLQPPLLALLLCSLRLLRLKGTEVWGQADLQYGPLLAGSALWAGLPDSSVFHNMPLFQAAASLAFSFGPGVAGFFCLLFTAALLLVYSAARLAAGPRAGLAAMALAGLLPAAGRAGYHFEQLFYSVLLLLVLNALLLLRRCGRDRDMALCGLAAGLTMLARTPLFAFAAPVLFCDWYYNRPRPAALLRRAALFLLCCWAPLLPWGLAKKMAGAGMNPLDTERGACNVLAAARGAVFSLKDDCRRAVGLAEGASPAAFYLREAAADPLRWAAGTARRLWNSFLFYPLLLAAYAAAALFGRREKPLWLHALPLYLLGVHSLLAVEIGYFYPLVFLLPPVMAALLPWREEAAGPGPSLLLPAAGAALLAAGVLVLALLYPGRAAAARLSPELLGALADRYPGNKSFKRRHCGLLRDAGRPDYLPCLAEYAEKYGDPYAAYHAAVLAAPAGGLPPAPAGGEEKIEYPLLRLLRAVELGDKAAAAAAYAGARRVYEGWHRRVNGLLPGEAETPASRLAPARLALSEEVFWEKHVAEVLNYWPAPRAAAIAAALRRQYPGAAALEGQAGRVPRPAAAAEKNTDEFAAQARACLDLSRAGAPERALAACQAALYLAATGPADPALAAAAAAERRRLLAKLGRGGEAEAAGGWGDR